MALKWFFSLAHKPKRPVPNVYFNPDDSTLIVIPEFDHPLPVYPQPRTTSHPGHGNLGAESDSDEVNRRPSPPLVSYHARGVSSQGRTAESAPPTDSQSTSDHSLPSGRDNVKSPRVAARRSTTKRKLRKSRRGAREQPTRAYDADLHWPTSVVSNTLPTSNVLDLPALPPTVETSNTLSVRIDTSMQKSFYANLSSPALVQSTSVESPLVPSTPSSDSEAPQRSFTLLRKRTKRKPPPPRPSPEPISSASQNGHAVLNDSSPSLNSSAPPNVHNRLRPSQVPADRRVTMASVAADYARFWNLSSPDLPTSGHPAYNRHSTIPTVTPPVPRLRTTSYPARKPVPGPSPLRDRVDLYPPDHHDGDGDLSYLLRGGNDLNSDTLPHASVLAAASQNFQKKTWPEDWRVDSKQSSPSLLAASSTYSAFALHGTHEIGESKSAWRSTWSVEETISDGTPKSGHPPASMSTTALDNLHTCPERSFSSSTSSRGQSRVWNNTSQQSVDDGLRRRWTVANAVTDEEIPDEVLIGQLERLRHHGDTENANVYGGPQARLQHARRRFSKHRAVPSPPRWLGFSDEPVWKTARSALLTCRELVRTERSYLLQIRSLLRVRGTATPNPGLVMTYAPALVHASEILLKNMLEDPSAWGIAAAFVKCEEVLESAFVSWCGIVGNLFAKKARSHGMARARSSSEKKPEEDAKVLVGVRRRGNSMPSVPTSQRHKSYSPDSPLSALLLQQKSNGEAEILEQTEKHSLRELAILPTQRVMRYVLLYRGLLEHTPSPPSSRAMVQDAVNAAMKVAQKCDRAQDNAEFLMN